MTVPMAEKLVKAVWYERLPNPPDKFVVLVDVDGKVPNEVLRPFQEQLPGRLEVLSIVVDDDCFQAAFSLTPST